MSNCWFVTGTDTNIGKTVVSIALLQKAKGEGFTTAGYKPIASGGIATKDGVRNTDALLLQYNSTVPLCYEEVNPLVFLEASSPHIISINTGYPILFSRLSSGLNVLREKAEWIFVEGAGGWYTPLSKRQTFADWVNQEQLPVLLVVGIKLGCINHALLTEEAVLNSGLSLDGWIANDIQPPGNRHQEYLESLRQYLSAPFLGEIPFLGKTPLIENIKIRDNQLENYLCLPKLHQ